mmetsp:Transcript_21620/g.71579  ORF Transcript_21620/g.71579 Transcript_21620/m.71579 type:complete len:88 (+) Transcript_21620:482-745(+)
MDGNNQTPLHRAAGTGRSRIVELLLSEGVDVNARDKEGNTALHLAMYEQQEESCVSLIRAGASTTIKNNEGETPLALAPDSFCEAVL